MADGSPHYDLLLHAVHLARAARRFPGPDYYEVLAWIHEELKPERYLEIGVLDGASLRLAKCPAIGVDPEPELPLEPSPSTRILRMTSNEFFERASVPPYSFAFIDGLHLFEQALLDFVNLERCAAPGAVIALHDTMPLDRLTSDRERTTYFYTGDVWKVIPCLCKHRPDLRMRTIRTGPTGLTLIGNLNPESTILHDRFDEIVNENVGLAWEQYRPGPAVENSREAVASTVRSLV